MGSICTKSHIESQDQECRFTEASVCFADEDSIIVYFIVFDKWIGGICIYQTFAHKKTKLASEVFDEIYAAEIEIKGFRFFPHKIESAVFWEETGGSDRLISPSWNPQATLDFGKVYSILMNCT